ncbi:uncharacterized protein LOC115629475 [Scaptodrosophila lebanonensis]|uniref:Uncharacterized protein LOC115629475 n=1 Tax=Drosophila lebanonensis TaxID=7225 RepID=A0A6J2TZ87_DROLE|nr:uncharacterized protein LOC115629475 [Scaptodrosophila lebanonensis]
MLSLKTKLRKTASLRERETHTGPAAVSSSSSSSGVESMALAKRRSRLQLLRGSGQTASEEGAVAFVKRDSRRDRRRGATGSGSSSSRGSGASTSGGLRKSQSLDAAECLSLASIQSPLWVTLTNARTIEELAQQKL